MIATGAYRSWTGFAIFNFVLLALAGTLLRYKIAFTLPFIDQKSLLHAHSHFAFSGWLTQSFMLLMVAAVSRVGGNELIYKFKAILALHLIAAYGMLLSFPFGGYYSVSISFSVITVITEVWFTLLIWREMKTDKGDEIIYRWFKSALFFLVISALGIIVLTWQMNNKDSDIKLFLAAEYFFMHFQYNGWFSFAGFGVFYSFLKADLRNSTSLRAIWTLFFAACIPAYFLSVLWVELPFVLYLIVVLAALIQVYAWIRLLFSLKNKFHLNGLSRTLLILVSLAFSIKLSLQAGSTVPELSHFAFGYRPVVIGYLHLMLLGVCSLFVFGTFIYTGFLAEQKWTFIGLMTIVTGIIINEILLFIQGVTAIVGTYLENIQIMLFGATAIILTGAIITFACKSLKRRIQEC